MNNQTKSLRVYHPNFIIYLEIQSHFHIMELSKMTSFEIVKVQT